MPNRQTPRLLAILLVAFASNGLRVGAAEEPPSLDQIKGDLKTVKSGTAPELTAPAAAPELAVPLLLAPAQEPAPPAPALSDPVEKKRLADPNWLVHAMTDSRNETGQQRHPRQSDGQPANLMPRDSADPNYLLKVYQAQESMEREKRESAAADALSPSAKPGDVGSFSDLLQRCLSPGDASLFRPEFAMPADADGGIAIPASLPATTPAAVPVEAPKPNPFLDATQQGLLLPGLETEAVPPSDVDRDAAPPPPPNVPEMSPAAPPPDSHRDVEPSRPARPADEKKYFPQLDRF
jgi:hypothetical protein